jgi:hypothetical protein
MVRHSVSRWLVALLAFGWAWPVAADAITGVTPSPPSSTAALGTTIFQTGNVATDMPSSSSSVTVINGQPFNAVAQPQWMTAAGLINGYAIQDIRLSYNPTTDTLAVGVNFYGIAGDTDGTLNGGTNPLTTAAGGSNPPHIGGDKSIDIAFTPVTPSGTAATPVVVAGVPANKVGSPTGSLDGFNVATVNASAYQTSGIAQAYGTTLTANLGALAYDPSQAHPGFEFTIKNFSKIPGLNALTNGFYISAYAGTGSTIIVGKSAVPDTLIAALKEPQNLNSPPGPLTPPTPKVLTPEPSTMIAWGLVAGVVGWKARRRLRQSDRS